MEEYVVRGAGCQPHWRRFNFTGIPICDNFDLLNKYGKRSEKITSMEGNRVIEATECLRPCTFMEYKVNVKCNVFPICLLISH